MPFICFVCLLVCLFPCLPSCFKLKIYESRSSTNLIFLTRKICLRSENSWLPHLSFSCLLRNLCFYVLLCLVISYSLLDETAKILDSELMLGHFFDLSSVFWDVFKKCMKVSQRRRKTWQKYIVWKN